eukprot:4989083-Prymnesium_polylepis.1
MLEYEGITVRTIWRLASEAMLDEGSVITAAGAVQQTASQHAIEGTPEAGVELGSMGGSAAESSRAVGQVDANATHFLVYLSQHTYLRAEGRAFADEVRSARAAGLPIGDRGDPREG